MAHRFCAAWLRQRQWAKGTHERRGTLMPLSSRLFQGDAALEAAANDDSAHITPGAHGPHVEKIQTALNILDSAGLGADGRYDPATATAVLSYKTKRNIINRSYQTSADNIVGKMTMAKLDEEMRAQDTKPSARIIITPISPALNRYKAIPSDHLRITPSNSFVAGSSSPVASIRPPVFGIASVTIDPGQTADIDIKNGTGYHLALTEFHFATNSLSAVMLVPGVKDPITQFTLTVDSLQIKVKGIKWGSPVLFAQNFSKGPDFTDMLVVNVRDLRPDIFHKTDAHHHLPVQEPGEWNKVCEEAEKDPDLGITLTQLAKKKASPETVVGFARLALFFKPMANKHFEHYLTGAGATVNEDENIKNWIKADSNARTVIAKRIREKRRNNESNVRVMFTFQQLMFSDEDAQFSFGAIDKLEAAADFVMGTVDVWFEDTYEWHPPYSQYKPRCPDIGTPGAKRDSNFGHAALVQMKARTAKDFQMRGRASFPMKIFPGL
jgi:peptidoglycan hydrolase-like protein with peptidoglycan-binding domain